MVDPTHQKLKILDPNQPNLTQPMDNSALDMPNVSVK